MAAEPQVRIRKAVPADAEAIAAFNMAMAEETEERQLDRVTVLTGVRRLLSDSSYGVYYLAELSGRCVGQLLITYEWSDWRNGQFWWIQSVYVTPEVRGRGVYRALHEWVARLARQTPRVCGLRLYVDRDNTMAQAVYGQLGLTPTNYELMEVEWPDDPTAAPPTD